jgi:hypothetical protein
MKYVHLTQAHIDDGMRKFEAGLSATTVTIEESKPEKKERVQ